MTISAVALAGMLVSAGHGAQPPSMLRPVPVQQVRIEDPFWTPKRAVWQKVTLLDCFEKFEKDGAVTNFDLIRDGKTAEHGGPPWYDGLMYEMIRAGADFLATDPDPELEKRIDSYIEHIAAAAAKDPDGYINTWTQLKEPAHRWGLHGGKDVWQHDIYNAGCLTEAAVHYYRTTGKPALLKVAARQANYMCDVMGPPPRKNVIPGHAVAEEAFVRLYELFKEQPDLKKQMSCPIDEERYLKLAEFWIDARGHDEGRPNLGAYGQDHLPVLQQKTIEGHAVRAALMCTGLAAIATTAGRDDYGQVARQLWENMVTRRTYIIGSIGSFAGEEKFGPDYVLPNDGYLETCAAVASGFFSRNMNLAEGDAKYADELERSIYNGALCGVSLKGDSYFYENPLETGPNRRRWSWHGCPCCPPMLMKMVAAMPGYIYATNSSGVYVNLFVGSRARVEVGKTPVSLHQSTCYPWEGGVKIEVEPKEPAEFNLNIRVPGWCQGHSSPDDLYSIVGRPESGAFSVRINGQPVPAPQIVLGYARIHRQWKGGDVVDVDMPMPVRRVMANPHVEADRGKVALMRGPLVYCLESVDNSGRVRNLSVPDEAKLTAEYRADLLGGVKVIRGAGQARFSESDQPRAVDWTAIPYYANANRGPVSMRVWIPRSLQDAAPVFGFAGEAAPTASHCNPADTVAAINDDLAPKNSADESIPRFTWWDHRGTSEWVQYEFDRARPVSSVQVYWFDETRLNRHCRVPKSWKLLYRSGQEWRPVSSAAEFGIAPDQFNVIRFDSIETTALRLEVQLQPAWSAGILEWRVAN